MWMAWVVSLVELSMGTKKVPLSVNSLRVKRVETRMYKEPIIQYLVLFCRLICDWASRFICWIWFSLRLFGRLLIDAECEEALADSSFCYSYSSGFWALRNSGMACLSPSSCSSPTSPSSSAEAASPTLSTLRALTSFCSIESSCAEPRSKTTALLAVWGLTCASILLVLLWFWEASRGCYMSSIPLWSEYLIVCSFCSCIFLLLIKLV